MPISSTKFNTEDLSLASSVTSNDFIEIRKYDSVNDSYESQKVSAAQVGKTYHEGHGIEIDSNNNINATTVGNSTYSTSPVKTGGLWIDNNDIFKKVINCGTLPNADTATIAHNISGLDKVIKWETIATDSTLYIDFNNLVEGIDATNITITTTSDMSGYTGYVTIYYTLKKQFHKLSNSITSFDGTNYWWFRITNTTDYNSWVGMYKASSSDINLAILSKEQTAGLTVANYVYGAGGKTRGSGNLVCNSNYNGYYYTIHATLTEGIDFTGGNNAGIQVIFDSLNDLLSTFYS